MKTVDRSGGGPGGRRRATGDNGRPGALPTLNEALDLATARRAARDALLRAAQAGDRPSLQQFWRRGRRSATPSPSPGRRPRSADGRRLTGTPGGRRPTPLTPGVRKCYKGFRHGNTAATSPGEAPAAHDPRPSHGNHPADLP